MAVRRTVVTRRTRLAIGANVAAMVLVVGGIVYFANWLAGRPLLRRQFDLTQHGRNTLSAKTVSLLRDLREPVEVSTFFRPDDYFTGPIQMEVVQMTEALLRLYKREGGGDFGLTAYDPDTRLTEAKAKFKELNLSEENVVVFRQGSRQKEVRLDDLAEIDRGDPGMFGGGGRPARLVSFKGEEALTNALVSVLESEERKVFFVKGHAEAGIGDTKPEGASVWADLLRKDGLRVEELDLPEKRGVPTDAAAVVIPGPTKRFTPEETSALRAYLERGGRLLVGLDPVFEEEEAGDPTGLLEEWGLRPGRGLVCQPLLDIFAGALVDGSSQCAQVGGRPLSTHEITRPLAEAQIRVSFPLARPLERTSSPPSEVRTANLVESSPQAWEDLPSGGRPDFRLDRERESEGVRTLAIAAEREAAEATASAPASDGGEKPSAKKARLVVVGSALAATNEAIRQFGRDLYMNAVNWLLERGSLISIAPKPPEERSIDLMKEGTKLTLLLGCVVFFPLVAMVTGLTVWFLRRR